VLCCATPFAPGCEHALVDGVAFCDRRVKGSLTKAGTRDALDIKVPAELSRSPHVRLVSINREMIGMALRTVFATGTLTALLCAGCTTAQSTRVEAENELFVVQKKDAPLNAEAIGQSAMQWHYSWTATNILERAADTDPTIENRFNLATGYQDTGRLKDALQGYENLVRDGKYTWLQNIRYNDRLKENVVWFNVADEAQKRIQAIREFLDLQTSNGPTAAISPSAGRVSDANALRLDGINTSNMSRASTAIPSGAQ
jgi:hypothetical protein